MGLSGTVDFSAFLLYSLVYMCLPQKTPSWKGHLHPEGGLGPFDQVGEGVYKTRMSSSLNPIVGVLPSRFSPPVRQFDIHQLST